MRKAEQQRPYSPYFVSAATLAYRLDCSERKISDYVKVGFIPKLVSIGNLVRWFWPEIVEYIKFQNGMNLEIAAPDDHRDVDEYTVTSPKPRREPKKRREKRPLVALPEHVHAVKAKGKTYFYYHPGRSTKRVGKRVRLPNDPCDSAFWDAYSELSGTALAEPKPTPLTFAALITEYKASPEYLRRKPRTRIEYDRHMATIEGIWGPRLVRGVRAKHVLQLRDSFASTPTKADHLVSMLSTLIAWGIPRDYAEINPCREVPNLANAEGFAPWEWEDITYARTHLKTHLWWAAALALYTGQRQSDVLAMKRDTLARGEIGVRQDKTNKLVWIPIHAELQPIIDEIPRTSVFLLTNSRGAALGRVASRHRGKRKWLEMCFNTSGSVGSSFMAYARAPSSCCLSQDAPTPRLRRSLANRETWSSTIRSWSISANWLVRRF